MKILLTSLGVFDETPMPTFYRMPPVSPKDAGNKFSLDFLLLLFCDQIVVDELSFDVIVNSDASEYSEVARTLKVLQSEGFIKTENYRSILDNNAQLLERMLSNDLAVVEQWVEPFCRSTEYWWYFANKSGLINSVAFQDKHLPVINEPFENIPLKDIIFYRSVAWARDEVYLHENVPWLWGPTTESERETERGKPYEVPHRGSTGIFNEAAVALKAAQGHRRASNREALKAVLSAYLSYVNANLVLSNVLGAGIHDWLDFGPFYDQKFLFVGKEDMESRIVAEESNRLFNLFVPEYQVDSLDKFLRILNDKRLHSLKELISNAVENNIAFDEEFVQETLFQILETERKVNRYRNMLSYLSLPIGFLPWLGWAVQKGVEEAAGAAINRHFTKDFRWFYMLSDLSYSDKPASRNWIRLRPDYFGVSAMRDVET